MEAELRGRGEKGNRLSDKHIFFQLSYEYYFAEVKKCEGKLCESNEHNFELKYAYSIIGLIIELSSLSRD